METHMVTYLSSPYKDKKNRKNNLKIVENKHNEEPNVTFESVITFSTGFKCVVFVMAHSLH